MKKLIVLLLTLMLTAGLCISVSAEETYYTFEHTGMGMSFDEALENSLGYVMSEDMGPIDFGHHVYLAGFTYFGMPRETVRTAIVDPELTDTTYDEIMEHEKIIRVYFATDQGLDAAKEAYDYVLGENYPLDIDRAVELGQAEGFTFYAVPNKIDDFRASLPEEYAKDLEEVERLLAEGEKNADLHAPVDADKEIIGKKIEFTTTDLDGNTVTSKELFAKNKYTLVNVWGIWCGNCMAEMEDLAKLHEKMQEKGCGLVGVDYENEDIPDGVEKTKQALADFGATYPNVLITDEVKAMCKGYPTTFFVDSEGVIQLCPIIGARPGVYEPAFEYLLGGGEKPDEALLSEAVSGKTLGTEFAAKAYTVCVKDENGPVQGVMIQFCDAETCRLEPTDAEGLVRFDVPDGKQYDIHILLVPEGYEGDSTVYHTETTYGQTDLTIHKK